LIVESWKVLENHPVNNLRARKGQGIANSVWPWGQGRPPRLATLKERFGIEGSVVAAVDLIRGIGKYAGLEILEVPGVTGYIDTNYDGKVAAALESLKKRDFVFLHVEAPDETSHSGHVDLKIKAIEDFDAKVVGPILRGLQDFPEWRILLMPDHPTPVTTRIHSTDPTPFVILDSAQWSDSDEAKPGFSEKAAQDAGRTVENAKDMIEILLKNGFK
jgi:2,3-bisphosphoglycerate-independent phosphoglycerate mutase